MASIRQELKEVLELGGLSFGELARRVAKEGYANNCLGQAAQLAYYFLFAFFPFLLFLTTLLGYIPIPNLMEEVMTSLGRFMPADALQLIRENLHEIVTQQHGGLLSFGIVTALWTSSSAVMAIMDNLNRAYAVKEERPLWKVFGTALLLVIGLSLFIIIATILLIFGPQLGSLIAKEVGLGQAFKVAWNILRWPVIGSFLILAMASIYYFGPDVEQSWKWITPGSVFTTIAWCLTSLGFSYYVSNFGSYNKIYGSIGTVIVLLTWMYLSGFFILIAGEINAAIEHAARSGKDPGEKQLPEPSAATER